MKRKFVLLYIWLMLPFFAAAQEICGSATPFEEKNGLLIIEMESVNLHSGWKMDSLNSGYTGAGYIYWDGAQYFSSLPNRKLTYNIKINTTGTYKFTWRMRVGKGTTLSEHNDTWLKIEADDFFGKKGQSIVKPKPQCQNNSNIDCPKGSSLQGFFKVFGQKETFDWASFTSDHDSHEIFATFNEVGQYKIILDARSSFCLLDRMVLRLASVGNVIAYDNSRPQSSCAIISKTTQINLNHQIKICPNPTINTLSIEGLPAESGSIQIKNIQGITLHTFQSQNTQQTIDLQELEQGLYYVVYQNEAIFLSQKFIKL